MKRAKLVLAVFALLVAMIASSAPAMAQPTDGPWEDGYGYPWGYGPYDEYYDYYDDLYEAYDEAYEDFEEGCTGVVSYDECIGSGEDLDYYLDDYYWDPYMYPYWDPYWEDEEDDS